MNADHRLDADALEALAQRLRRAIDDGRLRDATAVRLANGQVTTKSVFVPPEKDEAEITLTVSKDAKPQRQDLIVSGLMRANNQSIVRFTRAIPVQIVAP